jgi:hypothetical protein
MPDHDETCNPKVAKRRRQARGAVYDAIAHALDHGIPESEVFAETQRAVDHAYEERYRASAGLT